ncbi:MAG: VTT domain-containing protein [Terriglobales bacterium]|jgi:membrane protein YqaA with SNARE-associated domain
MAWLAMILLATKKSAMHWLIHLGGPGLILLGIADNSLIPLPGSTDVATILLAAHRREPWFYYAIMATLGAVLGGYLTYRMARKGGKETLEKKFAPRKVKRVYAIFERWGFASVAIPAILPPPFPITPMLLAAGALQYPTKKFLTALAVGRGIRYAILAYLGYHYGRNIVKFFSQYYWPVLIVLIVCTAAASLYGLYQYKRRQKAHRPKITHPQPQIRRRVA